MSGLSIKVNIAGRVYPLNISHEEEENVRRAAKQINDDIEKLRENYAVRDKQDLLAMTALQHATQLLSASKDEDGTMAESRLLELEESLDTFLS